MQTDFGIYSRPEICQIQLLILKLPMPDLRLYSCMTLLVKMLIGDVLLLSK